MILIKLNNFILTSDCSTIINCDEYDINKLDSSELRFIKEVGYTYIGNHFIIDMDYKGDDGDKYHKYIGRYLPIIKGMMRSKKLDKLGI